MPLGGTEAQAIYSRCVARFQEEKGIRNCVSRVAVGVVAGLCAVGDGYRLGNDNAVVCLIVQRVWSHRAVMDIGTALWLRGRPGALLQLHHSRQAM